MKTYTIYRHINKINGKSYIGITMRALEERWRLGKGYTKAHQPVFYNAIKKYGWDQFDHEILETDIHTLEKANEREQYWIAYYHTWVYDPQCNGYNNTKGGDGTGGHKLKEESKRYLKVYCVELDKIFDSLTEASKATGAYISKISECCHGKRDTANNYHWQFINEQAKLAGEEQKAQRRAQNELSWDKSRKKVYCIDENGLKHSFDSSEKAAIWWFNTYKPCGEVYVKSVLLRKIRESIRGMKIFHGKNQYAMHEITNIKWYLGE